VGGFSNDGKALSALLDKADVSLRDVGRSAGYYGAEERLQLSLAALRQLIASAARRPGRKIIIWISPGWPLMSGPNTQLDAKQQQQVFANIVSFSTQLRRAGVAIDSIDPVGPTGSVNADWSYEYYLKGVSKPSQVQLGNLGLPVLAVQSGGVAFNFTNGIADRLHKCLADAAPYYEISFDPPAAKKPDEYHHLEIKLAKSGLIARTLQGYYAQP
ncbi:MAG: VWA domain-containing protein, partial [Candidatus Acidiferrales bacterium]